MPHGRPQKPSLRQLLIDNPGVPPNEIGWHIFTRVFPLHARIWRNLRLLAGADPYDPEFAFVTEIAEAKSQQDVELAFESYHRHPLRNRNFLFRALGLAPSRKRVARFFRAITRSAPDEARRAAASRMPEPTSCSPAVPRT